VVGLLAAGALFAAAPAGASYVSGKQTIVSQKAGTFKMSGGLIGDWKVTSFKPTALKPVLKAKGTERFDGCLDSNHDGSCAGDPTGTLNFKFHYWAKLGSHDEVQLGTCAHRIVGGTGGLAGASGFLMMVDTPIGKAPFTKTHYEGFVTLIPAPRVGGGPKHC
jgi:hypothetical protein